MNKVWVFSKRIEGKYSESNTLNIKRMYKKAVEFETQLNKEIREFTKKELYEVIFSFKSKSYSTNLVYVRSMNIILEELGIETRLQTKEDGIDFKALAEENIKAEENVKEYFSEKEVKKLCNMLVNPCDQFLIYALFNGIELDDVMKLKTENIDLKNRKIYVFGKTILMDETMFEICDDVLNTTEYIRATSNMQQTYEFNMLSPYVIKVRPLSTNGNGMKHMTKSTVKMKLVALSKLLSTEEQEISVTSVGLKRSGIFAKISKKVKVWNEEEVRSLLREYAYKNNIRTNKTELYNMFCVLYK